MTLSNIRRGFNRYKNCAAGFIGLIKRGGAVVVKGNSVNGCIRVHQYGPTGICEPIFYHHVRQIERRVNLEGAIQAVGIDDRFFHSHTDSDDCQTVGDIQVSGRSLIFLCAFYRKRVHSSGNGDCVCPFQLVSFLNGSAQGTVTGDICLTETITGKSIYHIRGAVDLENYVSHRGSHAKLCEQDCKNEKDGINANKLFRHALPPDKRDVDYR